MKTGGYVIVVVVTLFILVAGAFIMAQPLPEAYVSEVEPLFDEVSGFGYLEELVTNYPQRDIWHQDGKDAAIWLRKQLEGFGLEVYTQEFSQYVKDELVTGQENVYGISRGKIYPDEYILLIAHYDIPPFVTQGAADNASSVGATLELARIFSAEEHNRSIIFLMSDSEEYGAMTGVVRFLDEFEEIDNVVAAIALDFMNMGEMRAISQRSMGLQQGYTPLWLRELTLRAIEQEGPASNSKGLFEWIDRSVAIAPTEAGVILKAGIPATNLGTSPVDRKTQNLYFHTREDTIDKLRVDVMGYYGRSIERTMRAIDELPVIPSESMFYFKFGDGYLPNWSVALLQLLFFAPLGYALVSTYRGLKGAGKLNAAAVKAEFMRWGAFFAAAVIGFIILKILPYTDLMYRYELYPATQKDPVLYNPQYLPVLIILAVMVVTFLLFRRFTAKHRVSAVGDWDSRKLAVLILLMLLALVAWVGKGGFAAVVFLFLPAYLWPLMASARGWGCRIINLVVVLMSNIVFFLFIFMFSSMYDIGVMWWYLLMSSSYGQFSVQGVLTVAAGLCLYLSTIGIAWSSLETSSGGKSMQEGAKQ